MLLGLLLLGIGAPQGHAVEDKGPDDACDYRRILAPGEALCIHRKTYAQDLCTAIEHYARENALPPDYFARLIWRESLFRPNAVSYRGAEGIAQFMPGTARLRGLGNSFHVLDALATSARYLGELGRTFGNLGLAAAAYNAGENGVSNFLRSGRLPLETRDYVFAITGHPIEDWRDKPPKEAAPPLEAGKPFPEACVALAVSRRIDEPILSQSADWAPWGVQLAAHYKPALASRFFTLAVSRLPAPLNAERALLVRQRMLKFGPRPRYAARIGRETRKEATELCAKIRAAGVSCIVLRNGRG